MKTNIGLRVSPRDTYSLVEFELSGPISPDDLRGLEVPEVYATKGVVISGRGPIWLHAYLAHIYHFTAFVAHYDPRLGGGVVVASHKPGVREGDVIPLE